MWFNRAGASQQPRMDATQLRSYIETNMPGLVPTLEPFLQRWEARHGGGAQSVSPMPPTPPPARGNVEQMPSIPPMRGGGTMTMPRQSRRR